MPPGWVLVSGYHWVHPILPGDSPQATAWAGQSLLNLLTMVFVKVATNLALLFLGWTMGRILVTFLTVLRVGVQGSGEVWSQDDD